MKITKYLLGFIALLFIACDRKQNITSEVWVLTEMTSGSMIVNKAENKEPSISQSYIFKRNFSFLKTQEKQGVKKEAGGKYTIDTINGEVYYHLNYSKDSPIIGSCSNTTTEELYLKENGTLQNTWLMCDGPLLIYSKK